MDRRRGTGLPWLIFIPIVRSSSSVDVTPRIKDVIGSNYCHIGVASDGDSIVLLVVLDNLVKGAAGGAVQWMNRQLGLAETAGLLSPAIAWT